MNNFLLVRGEGVRNHTGGNGRQRGATEGHRKDTRTDGGGRQSDISEGDRETVLGARGTRRGNTARQGDRPAGHARETIGTIRRETGGETEAIAQTTEDGHPSGAGRQRARGHEDKI